MRLKKVEVVGFKSFLDRSTFTFPSSITAVVGPNGCGKSNLVDAVLWAMGEMRPTHLRSRTMEDVIFNGTESLKPVGMAEVCLLFENDGGVPGKRYEQLSEIVVTRRLFRSGDSEYLINSVPCRLKDVRELFLGTGAGVNAYSIIEQGHIEMLISARPQDRRHLIEEAAGVTKYKEKKRETLQKMDRTRQNLLRVQDVIGEVFRQRNTLRRQAAQARRFKALQQEYKKLDIGLALNETGTLETEVREIRTALEARRAEELEKGARACSSEANLDAMKQRLIEEEEALSALEREIYQIEGDLKRDEEHLRALEREIGVLRNLEEQHNEELEGLVTEHERLKERKQASISELATLRSSAYGAREQLVLHETRLGEWEEVCRRCGERMEGLKRDVFDASVQWSRLQNRLEDAHRRIDGCERQRTRLTDELTSVQQTAERGEEKYGELEKDVEELRARKQMLDRQLDERQEALHRDQEALLTQQSLVKTTEGELHGLEVQLKSLLDMRGSFQGYAEGVRAIMTSKDPSLREGVVTTLAEVLEVDPAYEVALDSVLGYELQSLLVHGREQALRAIEYLREKQLGKVSFIPMNDVPKRSSQLQACGDATDVVGPLSEFVRVEPDYQPFFDVLLNDVWVVKDLASIMAMRNGGHGVFVTVHGDLWDRRGLLTGGSANGHPSRILTRKREINELRDIVSRKERDLKACREELATMSLAVKQGQEELGEITRDYFDLEKALVTTTARLDDERRELMALRKKEETIGLELNQLEMETLQLQKDSEGVQEGLAVCKDRKATQEAEIEAVQQELESGSEQRDVTRREVTALQVHVASLNEKEESLLRSLEELEQLELSCASQYQKKREQVCDVGTRLGEATREETDARRGLRDRVARRDELRVHLQAERERIGGVRHDVHGKEAALKECQSELRKIQDFIAEHEFTQREREMEMTHIITRVCERYHTSWEAVERDEEYLPIEDSDEARRTLDELHLRLERIGDVHIGAVEEYEELEQRHEFLIGQRDDLQRSLGTLQKTITEINKTSTQRFAETFERANQEFQALVRRLFNGGRGELVLDDTGPEPGVNIMIQPPGKRLKTVDLLSGGEKAMASIAFIFSLFLLRATPFCLLDEIDSPLDDANIDRFISLLEELAQQSQFVIITHNKRTMQAAGALHGVTMETPGISKVVSVQLN
jgi:chromosome segregation protein